MLLSTVPAAFQMPSASCLLIAACVSLTPFCRQAKTLSPYFFSAVWRRVGGTCCASVTCLSRPALHIMYEQEEYVVLSFPCPKASTSELYNGVSVPGRRSFPLSVVPMLDPLSWTHHPFPSSHDTEAWTPLTQVQSSAICKSAPFLRPRVYLVPTPPRSAKARPLPSRWCS